MRFVEGAGHPRLREHFAALIAQFESVCVLGSVHQSRAVDRALPVYRETVPLAVESAEEYRMNHLNEAEEMIPDYAARVPRKNGQGPNRLVLIIGGVRLGGEALLTLGECCAN